MISCETLFHFNVTDDVIQVITQLGPIMKQLSGVDMDKLLRDVSSLPAAVAKGMGGDSAATSKKGSDKVFGE